MEYNYEELFARMAAISVIVGWIMVAFAIIIIWKIFVKAGKKGWIALIPIYNTYTLFEISWGNGLYFLLLFLSLIPHIGGVVGVIIMIITVVKLGKAFGKGTWFIIGLVFLAPIFMAILAFDKSEYLNGPMDYDDPINNNQYYNPQPQYTMPNQNINTSSQVSMQSGIACTNCGTPLSSNSAFCPKCGKPKN